jgi:hypothetical protein
MMTRLHILTVTALLLTLPASQAAAPSEPDPRALIIEARNLAYDANYRNDQAGLRSAIATLQPLAKDSAEAAYANYYLSWAYWALAASQYEAGDVPGAVDSGTRAAAHARAGVAMRDSDPEFYTALVNALIVVAVLDRAQFDKMAAKIRPARLKALELGARNPRVVMMDAGMIFNNPPERGGGQQKGLDRYLEALKLFEAEALEKAADPLAPRWGHTLAYGWLGPMYLTITPPRKDQARSAAETALRMRPDFWYVRERVLPRLRN